MSSRSVKRPPMEPKSRRPIMARVIIDPSDETKDISIPRAKALKLYAVGKLSFDISFGAYCRTIEDERASIIPECLKEESSHD